MGSRMKMMNQNLSSVALISCALWLAGCSTLPGSGPSRKDISKDENEDPGKREYSVVKMDVGVVQKLGGRRAVKLNKQFSTTINGKPESVLGIGDQLAINIWETSGDGLFSTFEKKQTRIDAMVDEDGLIFIPYVGQVAVAGKSIEDVRSAIEAGLQGKAVEPQVQVALKTNVSNNLVVVGDVNSPGRYPLPVGGVRLLDVIARAGGSRSPIYESEAMIVRGEIYDTIRLDEILGLQGNNVWMQPSDTVQIMHKPRTFTAFGAVDTKDRHPFKTETLSLAEALAQAGGLNDRLADAAGVFLFRFEAPDLLKEAGVTLADTRFDGKVATVYRFDFEEPEAFFLARSFAIQDEDVIYVATAFAAEYFKFIVTYVNPVLNVARTGIVLSNEFE